MPAWASTGVRTGAMRVLARPGELAVGTAIYVVIVLAVSTLWQVAVEANDGVVDGYDVLAITWYLAISEAA